MSPSGDEVYQFVNSLKAANVITFAAA